MRWQVRSGDFTLGRGHGNCEGALFFLKKVDLFSRRRQDLSSHSSGIHIFGIFQRPQNTSDRIKQALRPNITIFPVKKSLNPRLGARPSCTPLPGYGPVRCRYTHPQFAVDACLCISTCVTITRTNIVLRICLLSP